MGLLSDHQIRLYTQFGPMIEPFVDHQSGRGVISYGLSSYGYDMRVGDTYEVFAPHYATNGIVDPAAFDMTLLRRHRGPYCILPPNSFALVQSVEYFRIPRSVFCLVVGKSTYARVGVIVNVTPLEPGWEGIVTIEISNTTPLPVKVYSNQGIAQVLFFEGDMPCKVNYADKKGKYQGQTGITTAIV